MDDSQAAARRGMTIDGRGTIPPHVTQPRSYDTAIGLERNLMVVRDSARNDPRVELITRIIGDHRNAPNLWLARRIVQALNEFEGHSNSRFPECTMDWYSDWDGIDPDDPTARRAN
jgi:hypothetical protein